MNKAKLFLKGTSDNVDNTIEKLLTDIETLTSQNQHLEAKVRQHKLHSAQEKTKSQLLEAVFDSCVDGIVAFDKEMRITAWNKNMALHYGFSKDEVLQKNLFAIFPEFEEEREGKVLKDVFKGKASFTGERAYKFRKGYYQAHIVGYRGEGQNIVGAIIILQDITEMKEMLEKIQHKNKILKKTNQALINQIDERIQAEKALKKAHDELEQRIVERTAQIAKAKQEAEEAAKAKAQFLANMSHEIRTPLNAIVGMSGLLLQSDPTEKQRNFIKSINSASDNLLALINDILDFSKIDAGKLILEETPFSIRELIVDLIKIVSFKPNLTNVKINTLIEEAVPESVIGDKIRLNQILLNLISNAVKFTEKGEIKVQVKVVWLKEQHLRLSFSVQDTGIGIAPDKLEMIFGSFTQANVDTTRKYGGSGLGLAIVKQLLELQGSKINIKSKVGKGSTFYFDLDFKKEANDERDSQKENSSVFASLEGVKVLVVEDNELNQILACHLLESWDAQADIAENGEIALDKIRKEHYDIVLMDIQMPLLDGYQTATLIRKELEKPKNNVPIVAMTANAFQGEKEKCIAAGMNDYITKPLHPEKLNFVINNLVYNSNL